MMSLKPDEDRLGVSSQITKSKASILRGTKMDLAKASPAHIATDLNPQSMFIYGTIWTFFMTKGSVFPKIRTILTTGSVLAFFMSQMYNLTTGSVLASYMSQMYNLTTGSVLASYMSQMYNLTTG